MINLKIKFAIFPVLAITLLFSALTISAQVVDTPEGTVEFIGLEEWTVEKIKAVMAEKAPNQPLGMCAAVLVENVGFASASAKGVGKIGGKNYTIVTLVEPQKARFLKEKPEPENSLPDDGKWRQGMEIRTKNRQAFHIGLDFYPFFLKSDPARVNKLLSDFPQYAAQFKELWQFLKMQNTPADFDRAIWRLNNDGNWRNRLFAAAILANFPDKDLTWWTLMDAQRDPFHAVANTASQVLTAFSINNPPKINWSPAVHSIRYIVNGTNVFLFTKTLQVLTKTNTNPELGRILLKDNSQLLLAHLQANYKPEAETAKNFLKHLSGKDFGYDIDKWRQWVKEIQFSKSSVNS